MAELSFRMAVTRAVDEEMARDPNAILLGEDVRIWGAPRTEFRGLYDKYGPKRVFDTPISEAAIVGAAIGAAATGLRPIANIMFANFLGMCGDELINQLTQMRYMFGGKINLPVTLTGYFGAGLSAAAQHSRTLTGLLLGIPGLKIVVPSGPLEALGLLKSAIRDDNPVICLHHALLLSRPKKGELTEEEPEGEYIIPLGKAAVKREGRDVTVVATAAMVRRALAAADKLQQKGISVEVVDLRTLVPLDKQTIIDSVKKTGRLVIMDEEVRSASVAGQIAAIIAEEAFDFLDAPIKRVCAPDTPVPYSPVLEKFWMPDEDKLIKAILE